MLVHSILLITVRTCGNTCILVRRHWGVGGISIMKHIKIIQTGRHDAQPPVIHHGPR